MRELAKTQSQEEEEVREGCMCMCVVCVCVCHMTSSLQVRAEEKEKIVLSSGTQEEESCRHTGASSASEGFKKSQETDQ